MARRLLVVEDRDSLRRMMQRALGEEGYDVVTAATGEEGVEALEQGRFDLVLTDLRLPGISGLDVLERCRARWAQVPVVVLTAFGNVSTAVEAMKLGAADFLEKPVEIDDLSRLVGRLLGAESESEATTDALIVAGAPAIVGRHPRLRAALSLVQKVAPTETTVLLTGESGTGKELFARALHGLSPRASGPFVAVNCAAIPEPLIENELFGHEKGAFTGASQRQAGRFEAAAGGTLFLDEIGELPLAVQSKVLRVLEDRTFERVGASRSLRANVRVVAATNQDLKRMVREARFRSDLFFRLDVFPIELPALRERASDVPLLARHLVRRIAERLHRPPLDLEPAVVRLLQSQPWPGNVRQLANVLERSLILADQPVLRVQDLKPHLEPPDGTAEPAAIRRALVESGGDKPRAAELLGMSYRTLQRKIRELDLEGFPKYRD
ncbi:MAG: sigma-54-dependent Fis family transcriptional regulator [Thermoanaerobaculia bacterium]|nr:sigma-54-dependent Fis family transcriptional regulator [Thermoanaerobaculia bacterium]